MASLHFNTDLEWKLLQAFVTHPEAMRKSTKGIFTDERQDIFEKMQLAYSQYGQLALDIVEGALGGVLPDELRMTNTVVPDTYIKRLSTLARRRQLDEAAQELAKQANEFEPNEEKVRDALVFEPVLPSQDISLHAGSMALSADIKRKLSGTYQFARTGLTALDNRLGGEWQRKSLTVIKARPGTGKTALMCTTMLKLAKEGIPSHLWSLEMAKEQLMIRWIAAEAKIDNTKILTAVDLTDEELTMVDRYAGMIQALPMTVAPVVVSMEQIITDTHYLAKQGVRVFGIDYLQIMGLSKFGNRNQDLGWIARELKELAKAYDISFIVLSQMNDEGEVRDSGEVEQVADVSIGLYPADDAPDTDGVSVVIAQFDKNRYGPVGKKVSLRFNGKYQYFADMGDGE